MNKTLERLGIIIVIESGDLEQKSLLLIESIRTFGGDAKASKIWAIKPRKGRALQPKTLKFLQDKGVEYIDINLNRKWNLYGFANKIYATAYIEKLHGDSFKTLLFLDSDTIVVNSIDADILESQFDVGVKPVEEESISLAVDQGITDFWEMIFDNCNVAAKDIWTVETTIFKNLIVAYFNSGVIFSNPRCHLFGRWLENFERLTRDRRAYHRIYREFYLIEQALLAGTILGSIPKSKIKLLDNCYNYPLLYHGELSGKYDLEQVAIIHYHEVLEEENLKLFVDLPYKITDRFSKFIPLKTFKLSIFRVNYKKVKYIYWRLKSVFFIKIMRNGNIL